MNNADFIATGICDLNLNNFLDNESIIVIFGATGDLSHRKILPALYNLKISNKTLKKTHIICIARKEYTHEQWIIEIHNTLEKYSHTKPIHYNIWKDMSKNIYYHQGTFDNDYLYENLEKLLNSDKFSQEAKNRIIYYLATDPEYFVQISQGLHKYKLSSENNKIRRLIVEKPFGKDTESAYFLNLNLTNYFNEEDIFRIDHYLGKDTVQNLLYFRFANSLFEPLWNRRYIDKVEINVFEKLGVEQRGGYYDKSGAVRDMIQNHLMQLFALVAMEPPVSLDAEAIRDEKLKVLKSVPKYNLEYMTNKSIRAQYIENNAYKSYINENKVDINSQTETFASIELNVDNWRWEGVPFILKTGKALKEQLSEINIIFRKPPSVLFAGYCGDRLSSNKLTIKIQPNEGIYLQINAKSPGISRVQKIELDFKYRAMDYNYFPEAYERLILDALIGDRTLFTRWDEVKESWRIIDMFRKSWGYNIPLLKYKFGSDGHDLYK